MSWRGVDRNEFRGAFALVLEAIHRIEERQEQIMADFTKHDAALTKLQTDVATLVAAVPDEIAAAVAADQTAVDAATAKLDEADAAVVAATPTPATVPAAPAAPTIVSTVDNADGSVTETFSDGSTSTSLNGVVTGTTPATGA